MDPRPTLGAKTGRSNVVYSSISLDEIERLEVLDLYKKDVDDEDLKVLSVLENLEFLSLASTRVSDDGVASLTVLKRLKELHFHDSRKLKRIVLWGTLVTGDGVESLREHLPRCEIDYDQARS